jgi:hypothetical protein
MRFEVLTVINIMNIVLWVDTLQFGKKSSKSYENPLPPSHRISKYMTSYSISNKLSAHLLIVLLFFLFFWGGGGDGKL